MVENEKDDVRGHGHVTGKELVGSVTVCVMERIAVVWPGENPPFALR